MIEITPQSSFFNCEPEGFSFTLYPKTATCFTKSFREVFTLRAQICAYTASMHAYIHVQYFVYPIVYSAFIIVAKKLYGQYLFIHIPLQSVPPTNQKNTVKKKLKLQHFTKREKKNTCSKTHWIGPGSTCRKSPRKLKKHHFSMHSCWEIDLFQ